MTIEFTSDLHVHLYGCLTAEDIWELGRDAEKDEGRMAWFTNEYAKAFGFTPDWRAFWENGDAGFDLLAATFIFADAGSFAQFQAKFNLMIALFPVAPGDNRILKRLLHRHAQEGLKHIEYRFFLPPLFSPTEIATYLTTLGETVAVFSGDNPGGLAASLAVSVTRNDELLPAQYAAVKAWQRAHRTLGRHLTGLDFSHFEEGFPPAAKRDFFRTVQRDNKGDRELALAILYHVGESFSTHTISSAARWVAQAAAFGAHRLGHAIALGVKPENYRGQVVAESAAERVAHLNWLRESRGWLDDAGYNYNEQKWSEELHKLSALPKDQRLTINYDDDFLHDCHNLQDAILRHLAGGNVVIESCPTSNERIGQIGSAAAHPLPRFGAAGVKVCVASDDPGIFNIRLADELSYCREKLGLTDRQLQALASTAESAKSTSLVR